MTELETWLNELADELFKSMQYTGYVLGEGLNADVGDLIRRIEKFYNLKDDSIPWSELDREEIFQEIIDLFASCCISQEATNILAIFCLDRGLFNCQMNSLKDEAYDEYLMSAVVSAKRLMQ